MLTTLALCLALCAGDGSPGKEVPAARPFHEIQADLSDLLKREALTKDAAERARLVRQLCDLHHEILHHPRHETAEAMKGYRVQAWGRLKRVQADLKNQLARQRKVKGPIGTDPELLAASDSLAAALNLADSSLGGPSAWLARVPGWPVAAGLRLMTTDKS